MLTVFMLHGQTTPEQLTDKFFELYSKSPKMAINDAFSFGACSSKTKEQKDTLINQTEQFQDLYGWYISHEKLVEETEGESLKILTYLVKYDCQPIRLILVLYKAKDDWSISNIYIDNDFGSD
ncbi:MAG: hypothetical protein COA57_15495 [Flavobacteriales bacterium]|nr:MAG: hypothetical protein COA57_15495 [Flavobacteriales bacterium]